MYVTFSQEWARKEHGKRIRGLFNRIKTEPAPHIWLKVLFYTEGWKAKSCDGHYRHVSCHGFYPKEWDFLRRHRKIQHVITLKVGKECPEYLLAHLIAHEYAHYLQFHRVRYNVDKRRFQKARKQGRGQGETHADRWATHRLKQIGLKPNVAK